MRTSKKIVIVGAGPAGLVTAVLMARRGHDVTIIERRLDPTLHSFEDSRSVNFSISPRGRKTLEAIDAWNIIEPLCAQIKGRSIHKWREMQQTYNTSDPADTTLFSIKRIDFIRALIGFARQQELKIKIIFGSEFVSYENNQVSASAGFSISTYPADFIIGADGTSSKVACYIREETNSKADHSVFDWVYKTFRLSSSEAEGLRLKTEFIHFFPDSRILVLALPNVDGTFGCNLFYKSHRVTLNQDTWTTDKNKFSKISATHQKLAEYIDSQFQKFPETEIRSHIESCWHFEDKALILGDAAHSVFHFYAQGLNSALEDVLLFTEEFDRHSDIETCFTEFESKRVADVEALRQMSKDHFYFLKDKAGSVFEAFKKNLVVNIMKMTGIEYENTYRMVVRPEFSYSQAYKEIQKQKSMRQMVLSSVTKTAQKKDRYA